MASKTLIYKVAKFHDDVTDRTLQELLTSALKKKKTAFSRKQPTEEDGGHRVINYHSPYKTMRVGEFFGYTDGHCQPLARISESAETFDLSSLEAPPSSEFLESIFYFGILDNHVIACQSSSLRVQQFETYLNWLFRETGLITDEQFIFLADQTPQAAKQSRQSIKGMEFAAPVKFSAQEGSSQSVAVTKPDEAIARVKDHTSKVILKPLGVAWNTLQALIPKLVLPTDLDIDQVVGGRELTVKVELSWKGAQKDDSSELLDTIANQFRHVDDQVDFSILEDGLDFTLITKSGARITRDSFKLRHPISVRIDETSGLPVRDELWEKMKSWIEDLLSENSI